MDDLSQAFAKSTITETAVELDLSEYDSTIIISHFRSHDIVGFNGAIKQMAAISGLSSEPDNSLTAQEKMELLLEAGKQVVDNLNGEILYINVMDRLSIESSGVTLPESNTYSIGILSSYDPVALDQACIDLVNMLKEGEALAVHIESCNGIYTLIQAEKIGLGSRTYALTIDN